VIKLEDNLEIWRTPSRIVAALSGALGALALLLSSIGVYGMVSYSVSRSEREIGIRMALGANGANVMHLVLWQAMRPVLIGGLVGIVGVLACPKCFPACFSDSARMPPLRSHACHSSC
jgi:ABC-type antimicrobial peptide transport system permease subunit